MEEPMRRSASLILTILMIALSACYSGNRGQADLAYNKSAPAAPAMQQGTVNGESRVAAISESAPRSSIAGPVEAIKGEERQVSLDSAGVAQAFMRKVIQNAEMTIETDTPNEGQQKIGVIAEKHGGFVVVSESKQNEAASQNVASTIVNIVVRVPAQNFQATLDEICAVGGRILHRKTSGQDVTEEYIDLEARIRTKKALEAQFLEIMKQARKISDAMEVQTQLAEVRTEIERLEGRRRFLENQSAL